MAWLCNIVTVEPLGFVYYKDNRKYKTEDGTMSSLTITQNNFKSEVLDSATPVLVDFWASWCGPCRMLSPVVDQIAQEKAGAVKVAKINVDDEPQLAAQFGVMSIPTLVLFRDGRPVSKSVGVRPKQAILGMLEETEEAREA